MKRLLLAPDPAEGNGGTPDPTPAPKPGTPPPPTPNTPKLVAKTPLKTPREIALEKDVSKLQDEITGLRETVDEINNFLGELNLGRASVPIKAGNVPSTGGKPTAQPTTGGFFDTINQDIWGGN